MKKPKKLTLEDIEARFVLLQGCGHIINESDLFTYPLQTVKSFEDPLYSLICPRCKTKSENFMRVANLQISKNK